MITVDNNARIFINKVESNFFVYEFVAPEIWNKWGVSSIRYIQEPIILATQFLRTKTGLPITICDWKSGGTYKDSGTRVKESYDRMYGEEEGLNKYLATYSMHKFCGADDLKIGSLTSKEMADVVKENEKPLMEIGIKRIENPQKTQSKHGKLGRDWLHMDTAITGLPFILQVDP